MCRCRSEGQSSIMISVTDIISPATSSPVTLAATLPSAKTPCFTPSQPILTPAPDKRKERTPPTPPENIPKHARAEMDSL